MSDEDKFLRVVVQYVNDTPPDGPNGPVTGAKKLKDGLKAVETQAVSTMAQLRQLRAVARELNQVATITLAAGTALSGPFVAAAAKYIAATGQTEAVSRKWLAATKEIENSVVRIGRVATTDLLPGMQKISDLSDKLANYLEKNPGAVDAALKIGGTLITVGVIGKAVAEGIKFYADVKLIAAAALQDQAADKMLVAAGEMAGAAGGRTTGNDGGTSAGTWLNRGLATVGAVAGAGIINNTWQSAASFLFSKFEKATGTNPNTGGIYGFEKNLQTNYGPAGLGQIGALTSALWALVNKQSTPGGSVAAPAFFSPWDSADRSRRQTEGLAGPSATATASAQAIPLFMQYQAQQAQNFNNYDKQYSALGMNYLKQSQADTASFTGNRTIQTRDFNEQSARIEKAYNAARLIQLRDFNENETKYQEAYNDQQAKAARNHTEEMQRLAQDFADRQKQALDQHNQNLHDLAAAGDALGFVKEKENFAKQQVVDKTNYDKEVTRRNADYAQQAADAKQAFDEARAQRLADFKQSQDDARQAYDDVKRQRQADFNQQQQDEQNAFDERERQLKDNFKQQKSDLTANYVAQQKQATDAFTAQLNAIDPILTGMNKAVTLQYQTASDEFQKFITALQDQVGGGPGYCAAGYHWDSTKHMCIADKPSKETHAAGGYAWAGAVTGPGEYVLNRTTADAEERLLGGVVTQNGIMTALARGGGMSIDMPISISGTFGRTLIDELVGMVDDRMTQAFNELTSEIGNN